MQSRLTFLNWIEVGNVKSRAGGLALPLGLPTFCFLRGRSTFMASLSGSRGISCSDIIIVSESDEVHPASSSFSLTFADSYFERGSSSDVLKSLSLSWWLPWDLPDDVSCFSSSDDKYAMVLVSEKIVDCNLLYLSFPAVKYLNIQGKYSYEWFWITLQSAEIYKYSSWIFSIIIHKKYSICFSDIKYSVLIFSRNIQCILLSLWSTSWSSGGTFVLVMLSALLVFCSCVVDLDSDNDLLPTLWLEDKGPR